MTGAERSSQSVGFVDAAADQPQRPERLRWYAATVASPFRVMNARPMANPAPRVNDGLESWLQRAAGDDAVTARSF
jgi:hypothetical protein